MEAGGPLSPRFCPRLIRHTKGLMESEEKLCVKVLRTLQQMLLKKSKYGDRVSVTRHSWARAGSREAGPCSPKASPYPPRATSCGRCSCRITSRTASPAPGASSLTPQALVSATAPPFPALHGWLLLQTAVSHTRLLPKAWIRTGQPSRPPSAGWTRRGPPSWCVISSPVPRTRRSSRRASGWPSACWMGATLRSRCWGRSRGPPAWRGELWYRGRTTGDPTFRTCAHGRGPVPALYPPSCPPRSTILAFQGLIFLAFFPSLVQSPNSFNPHSFTHSLTH